MRVPPKTVNRNLLVLMKKNWSLYKWATTLHIQWTSTAKDLRIALGVAERFIKQKKTGRKLVRLKEVTVLSPFPAITNKLQVTCKMIPMVVVSTVAKPPVVPQAWIF